MQTTRVTDGVPDAPRIHHGPGRGLLLIAAGALLLAVVAIALVLARGDRQATYPPGSPEAAYQAVLTAWAAGDRDAVYDALSSTVQASWTREQYRGETSMRYVGGEDAAVSIERATVDGDRATLRVAVERIYRAGLQDTRSRNVFEVRLVREAGVWRIDQRMTSPTEGWW